MKKGQKIGIIVTIAAVIVIAAAVLLWWFLGRGGAAAGSGIDIYVDSVGMITGTDLGMDSRYSGVVEAQKTLDIQVDSSKTVAEIYVQEGQEVSAGDPLFRYDVDELNLNLQQAKLELEGIQNEINMYNGQVTDWQKRTDKTSQEYLLGLQDLQLKVREAEYRLSTKQFEIEQIEKSVENAVVTSEMDGTVKSINEQSSSDYYGEQKPFMSILASGNYWIKCKVSELSIQNISEGMAMRIVSRVNPEDTWSGVIEKIDRENSAENSNNGISYGSENTMTQATSYYFYVALDNIDGLMLGQHVYVEADNGDAEEVSGLWLPEYYINQEEDSAWVWAEDGRGRMEKRTVTLGEYNADMGTYEITDGLTAEDYIAFPSEDIEEGANALHFSDSLQNGGAEE